MLELNYIVLEGAETVLQEIKCTTLVRFIIITNLLIDLTLLLSHVAKFLKQKIQEQANAFWLILLTGINNV